MQAPKLPNELVTGDRKNFWGGSPTKSGPSVKHGDSPRGVRVTQDTFFDVLLDTSGANQEITLYFQNTGVRVLDKDSFTIFVDGVSSSVVGSTTLYPSNGVWATDYVIEVTVTDASFSYSDNDLVTVTIIAQSTVTDGVKGTDSETAEVRLSV